MSAACRISVRIEMFEFVFVSSVPSPTVSPAAMYLGTGAYPEARNMLLEGQCEILTSFTLNRRMSRSSSHTQCAPSMRSSRKPRQLR